MTTKQSPRNLPHSSRRAGTFTPRRSYARARASRERVDALSRIERNQRSQQSFARNLKIVINVICVLGILGLLIFTLFFAQSPEGGGNAPKINTPEFSK